MITEVKRDKMMGGIIALLIAAAIIFLGLKLRDDKTFLIIIIIIVGVFLLSSAYVIKSGDISLKEKGGLMNFVKSYNLWLTQIFGNFKSITGSTTNADWKLKTGEANETINNTNPVR